MNRKKRVYQFSRLDEQFLDSPLNAIIVGALVGLVVTVLIGWLS